MNSFIKNIIKVSFSNIVSMISGILVGFLVPKIMGMDGYANYKIYTLYLTYLAILSLGFGDGLYLLYSGKSKEELDANKIKRYMHIYYIQLFAFFSIAVVISLLFISKSYRFIAIALAISILSSQIISVHQNLSIITSSFNEYSIRVVLKAVLTSAFLVALFFIHKLSDNEIPYYTYVCGIVLIDLFLAIWYLYTYREFNFGKCSTTSAKNDKKNYLNLLFIGFPLLLSNMAGSVFLNLDRQFVSILFEHKDYAIYAFAYNMLTLITTMTSAVSLVLFPSLKRINQFDMASFISRHMGSFNSVVSLCLVAYFPLCWLVPIILPKYSSSLEIFRIVLPGLVLSTSVSVLLINLYKVENNMKAYFKSTIICMAISIITNLFAYALFRTYTAISWASIITLFIWYMLELRYFVINYGIKYRKNTSFMLVIISGFYIISYCISNLIVGAICYIVYFGIIYCVYNSAIIKDRMRRIKGN